MRRNLFVGIILITFGVLFLFDNLGIADFGDVIHDYWPIILILWGLSFLMRSKRSSQREPRAVEAQTVDRELLHESNVFGDIFIANSSKNFKGGSISTVFGDCDVDLSSTIIAEGEHILRFHSVFGDSSIILPKDAPVSVSATSTFGSLIVFGQKKDGFSSEIHASAPNYETSPKKLTIIISKVFGDVRVG